MKQRLFVWLWRLVRGLFPKPPPEPISPERTMGALGLVLNPWPLDDDRLVLSAVAAWTPAQREAAFRWAWLSHLRANDNEVDVPPVPDCVRRLDEMLGVDRPVVRSND